MTPPEMQLLLQDVELAQRQLTTIASRLKLALGGYQTRATKEPYQHPPSPPEAKDQKKKPDEAKLAEFCCPKCKAPMRWQWSRANNEWFAGCSTFDKKNCRGSRSFNKVMGTEGMTEVINGDKVESPQRISEAPEVEERLRARSEEPEVLPYTTDDVERIKKHHGEGAAADAFATGEIPF